MEKINPNLIVRDLDGKAYTVRYEAVSAMLLNEFLKEDRKVEQQQATIGRLETTAAKQETNNAKTQQCGLFLASAISSDPNKAEFIRTRNS